MDSRQISLVQESFERIPLKARQKLTRVIYDRLFELNPELKSLFKKDIREQRKKLLKMLTYIIENLNDAEIVGPTIKELAKRHANYGVKPKDYNTFGKALFFAMSAALGDDFTPATKEAWKGIYKIISDIMIEEAH